MWYPKTPSNGWTLSYGECSGIGPNGDMGIKDIYGLPIGIGILKTPGNGFLKLTRTV
jgi:hypothetical protein